MVLYLQHVADSAVSFSAVKSASAAIAYFQRMDLYSHEPTMGQLASFVRNAAMRRLGWPLGLVRPHLRGTTSCVLLAVV